MAKSIMETEKGICYLCKKKGYTHLHHIYGGTANRKVSDGMGFTVYLCPTCHSVIHSSDGYMNKALKKRCQEVFERQAPREAFIELIGKSYL